MVYKGCFGKTGLNLSLLPKLFPTLSRVRLFGKHIPQTGRQAHGKPAPGKTLSKQIPEALRKIYLPVLTPRHPGHELTTHAGGL